MKLMKKAAFALIILVWLLAGCRTEADPTPTAVPPTPDTPVLPEAAKPTSEPELAPSVEVPAGIRISEMLAGIDGNNNYEFIELYNGDSEPVNLAGWSLWYQLTPDRNPEPVYRWEGESLLPGRGHSYVMKPPPSRRVISTRSAMILESRLASRPPRSGLFSRSGRVVSSNRR